MLAFFMAHEHILFSPTGKIDKGSLWHLTCVQVCGCEVRFRPRKIIGDLFSKCTRKKAVFVKEKQVISFDEFVVHVKSSLTLCFADWNWFQPTKF